MADHIHDENCDHDHDEAEGEIEITINPRDEDLDALGVTPDEFEAALMKTLEAYDKTFEADDPDSLAPLEDAEIVLAGKTLRLQEVADIEISGDLDSLGHDEGDEEDDDLDEDEEDADPDHPTPH